MTWQPSLEGEAAEAALRLARAIALEVAKVTGAVVDRTVFWAYASNSLDEPFANAAYECPSARMHP